MKTTLLATLLLLSSMIVCGQQAPPSPDEGKSLFFYDGGAKVKLEPAGLCAIKLKEGKQLADIGVSGPTSLSPNDPLNAVAKSLERSGVKMVATNGGGLNADALTEKQRDAIDSTMPVVQTVSSGGEPVQMLMPSRILATFSPEMNSKEKVDEYVKPFGLKVSRNIYKQTYLLEVVGDANVKKSLKGAATLDASNSLFEKGSAEKKVISSHPDFIVPKTRESIGDPRITNAWHLKNDGTLNGAKPGADAKVVEAWLATQVEGSADVKIAIIDDSVESAHPDLANNIAAQIYYDGLNSTSAPDSSPRDATQRHGTPCAGVAAACGNTIGSRGAAPKCSIIGVHFWDASVAQVIEAFQFCEANGAAVISCSWSWQSPTVFADLRTVIDDIATNGRGGKGVVILFAAGNEGGQISQHQQFGTLDKVLCVGATNWRDDHSEYSNFGPELDIVAPSNDPDVPGALAIDTTDNTDNMPKTPGKQFSGYAKGEYTGTGITGFGGTSSATPLVAGICGLIISANPALTADQVKEVLLSTADKNIGEGTPADFVGGRSIYYGHGRVNAARAVQKAIQLKE